MIILPKFNVLMQNFCTFKWTVCPVWISPLQVQLWPLLLSFFSLYLNDSPNLHPFPSGILLHLVHPLGFLFYEYISVSILLFLWTTCKWNPPVLLSQLLINSFLLLQTSELGLWGPRGRYSLFPAALMNDWEKVGGYFLLPGGFPSHGPLRGQTHSTLSGQSIRHPGESSDLEINTVLWKETVWGKVERGFF